MSKAKRVLFVVLGILLLIVAVGWGNWSYWQYRGNQTPIPRNATSIVRIHVGGLIRDIAWNALWNGTGYRDTTGKPSITFSLKRWEQLGILIPANLFLYQLDHARSGEFPGVYFGSVAVDDSTTFTAWLQDKLGMEISFGEYGAVASSARALVVIRQKRALFALSPAKPKTDITLLTDMLANVLQQHGGNVSVSKSDFREIIHDGGQVSGRGTHRYSIGFKKGLVVFNGGCQMDYALDRLRSTPHFADSNAASLWLQGDLTAFLSGRRFDIGGYALHGDSLLVHYRSSIALEWKRTATQQDTIVNFDYDDNFELVETREIVDKFVPEIYCSVRADTGFTDYLRAQGVLEATGNAINRNAFPLFRLGVSTLPSGHIQFHTASEALALPTPSSRSDELLYVRVDFNKLKITDLPPFLVSYKQAADFLELSGRPTSANEIAIHGTLRMKDPQLHSLVQLLALLNQ